MRGGLATRHLMALVLGCALVFAFLRTFGPSAILALPSLAIAGCVWIWALEALFGRGRKKEGADLVVDLLTFAVFTLFLLLIVGVFAALLAIGSRG
jgi:hypothetical protein